MYFRRQPIRHHRTDNPADHSLGYRRRFVLALMEALELERAALVGHSQAGRIAVELALGEPQRITKIVVLCTGSLLPALDDATTAEGDEGTAAEPTLADPDGRFRRPLPGARPRSWACTV